MKVFEVHSFVHIGNFKSVSLIITVRFKVYDLSY
jgi:hypothetical protein